ncbi:outer membrane protein assembly factor BamB family protein [Streptomyces otsuchiensis]|uniref:outer membrane protein assembly factor BamB family protein n=1 Tax=Streptomyces otsuchiensis TaxID=2681388 RepID=UPI0010312F82|nr:PQQ-binding-like beta-propeller repeat protein [Streptomyces otsuchiensis]
MTGRTRRALTGAALITMLAATACGGGDADRAEDDGPGTGAGAGTAATVLSPLWEQPSDARGFGAVWTTTDALVLRAGDEVRALDPADGAPLWTLDHPDGAGRICQLSRTAGGSGIGGVLFATAPEPADDETAAGSPEECSLVAAVDTATGDILWTDTPGTETNTGTDTDAPDARPAQPVGVSAGESVLTVSTGDGGLHRYALTDGAHLPALSGPDDACTRGTVHDGTLVAAVRDPAETGTDCAERAGGSPLRLDIHDAETGALSWSAEIEHEAFALRRVLAGDPLVVEATGAPWDGAAVLSFPDDGDGARTLGPAEGHIGTVQSGGQQAVSDPAQQLPVSVDGVFVAAHDVRTGLTAHDTRTGEELWARQQPDATPVGARGTSLLATGVLDGEQHLLLSDPRDQESTESIGALECADCVPPGQGAAGAPSRLWVVGTDGERFYALVDAPQGDHLGRLVAYPVPD